LRLDHVPEDFRISGFPEVAMEKRVKQDHARKTVHITWNEAQRAEAERERVRCARCKSLPARRSLLQLIVAGVSSQLPKLKATALRFVSAKNH
jgi:hypothetical protein